MVYRPPWPKISRTPRDRKPRSWMQVRLVDRKATLVMWQPILPLLGLSVHAVSLCGGGGGRVVNKRFYGEAHPGGHPGGRTSTNSHLYTIGTFLVASPCIDSCLNLSKTATCMLLSSRWPLWRSSTVHHFWLKKKPFCIPSIEKCCPLNIPINKNKTENRFRITWNKLQWCSHP